MTLLVVDFGNHRWKWAMARNQNALESPGHASGYGDDFQATLDTELTKMTPPDRVVAVSVTTESRVETFRQWIKARWSLALELCRPGIASFGVANQYQNPGTLGADRWAALVGARHRTRESVSVVDAGTAVTIDALDSDGVFRGGVILPGLNLQRESLRAGTAAMLDDSGSTTDVLGRSTADAVAAGTLIGLAGAINLVVTLQSRRMNASPRILLTGGDATRLYQYLEVETTAVPDLVLEGIALMAEGS